MTEVFTSLYDDPLRLGALWIAMIFWSVVYIFLGWYLDKVFPGEYGIKMPFYFPFMVTLFSISFLILFRLVVVFVFEAIVLVRV